MLIFASFLFGLISGFVFRSYALLILSPLSFAAGFLIDLTMGQHFGSALWSGLMFLAAFQLAYLLGIIGAALLKREEL